MKQDTGAPDGTPNELAPINAGSALWTAISGDSEASAAATATASRETMPVADGGEEFDGTSQTKRSRKRRARVTAPAVSVLQYLAGRKRVRRSKGSRSRRGGTGNAGWWRRWS